MATNLVLIVSDDSHLLMRETDRVLTELRAEAHDPDVYVHDVADLEHLPSLRTVSLFGGTTIVVLRSAESLSGALKDEVEAYVTDPDPSAVLVMAALSTQRIQKITRAVAKVGQKVEVKKPRDYETAAWQHLVQVEARTVGKTLAAETADVILDHAGLEPAQIASLVRQVAAATSAAELTPEHVSQTTDGIGDQGAFAVADAVAGRDASTALRTLVGTLDAGNEPLKVLGAVAARYRDMLSLRGGSIDRPMPPRVREQLVTWGRSQYGPGELSWCLDRLRRADRDLKGGSALPARTVLELTIVDLLTPRDPGPPWNPMALR